MKTKPFDKEAYAAQKKEEVQNLLNGISEKITAFRNSDDWKEYLSHKIGRAHV